MLKGVIGVIEQNIAVANGVEAVAEAVKADVTDLRQRPVDQVAFADVREADKVFEVMVAAARHDGVVVGDGQLIAQQLHHGVRHIALIDEAHRLGGQTLLQARGHQLQQARFHLRHQIVFRVARHLHRIGVQRVVIEEAFEDIVEAVAQNIVQQDHRLASAR